MRGIHRRLRYGLASAVVAGGLLGGTLLVGGWAGDPYGGAFTGPCRVVPDESGHAVAELQLTDHGPPVEVGRVAVSFTGPAGERLPTVRVEVGADGGNVFVAHAQTRTFSVAGPSRATTCRFEDWASAGATTWGGHGAAG